MAKLPEEQKFAWMELLAGVKGEWVLFGIDLNEPSFAKRLEGMVGLIDWSLHGQVSQLMKKGNLEENGFSLYRGPGSKQYPNFLCYAYSKPNMKEVTKKILGLGIKNFVYAESTFPKDFPQKLEQTISTEGVTCTKLEQ